MATEVTVIVDPDNGSGTDYTSLAAAVAGEARNLVTADEQLTIKCRCTGGTADGAVTISGFTTDATRYVKIWTDPSEGYRHSGVHPSGNKYRIELPQATSTSGIRLTGTHDSSIIGISIQLNHSYAYAQRGIVCESATSGSVCKIDKCVIAGGSFSTATSSSHGIYCVTGNGMSFLVSNCVVYGLYTAGYAHNGIYFYSTGSSRVYNCTVYNCSGYGVRLYSSGTVHVKNSAVFSCGLTDIFKSSGTLVVDYCATDDGIGTNAVQWTGGATDWANVFADYANGDFSLNNYTGTGAVIGAGTDDPGSGLYSDDILGNARTSTWDIGAFEYVSAGYSLTSSNGSFTLSGQAAGVRADRAIQGANGSVNITGQSAGLLDNKLVSADYSQLNLYGQDSGLRSTRLLSSDNGLYSVTGQDVTLSYLVSLSLAAGYGQFNLSGQDVDFLYSKLVNASVAEFVLSGQAALFKYSKAISAEFGGYNYTGQAADLLKSLKVSAEYGAFSASGQDATLLYTPTGAYALIASYGDYSVLGQQSNLLKSSTLTSQYGSFSLSGQDSLFRIGRLVSAEPGVYQLSGQALSFIRSYVLSSNTGLYVLSGQDASLVYIPHEELLLLAETGIYTVVFPTVRLKPSSEYAVTCSKIFKSPIFAILYANSEIIAAVSEKSIVSKELVYNERDICW